MKKIYVLFLVCFAFMLAFAGCSGDETSDDVTIRVAALKGPTGMGMAKLMEMRPNDTYIIEGAPDTIVGKLTTGEVDIAALPTNLGATLYNKTGGEVQIAAVNTLGVLYILSSEEEVKTVADLKGKTIIGAGQGTTAQYILEYILTENGLTVGEDVTVDYRSEHSEVASLALAGEGEIYLLPEPFVTSVMAKSTTIRIALDLTEEWDDVSEEDAPLPMGGLIVRKAFVEEHPEAFAQFMEDYQTSTEYANNNPEEAAALMETYGIMDAAVAEKAIPNCNIVFLAGEEMKTALAPFYEILFAANPASIGGTLPEEDFYYIY